MLSITKARPAPTAVDSGVLRGRIVPASPRPSPRQLLVRDAGRWFGFGRVHTARARRSSHFARRDRADRSCSPERVDERLEQAEPGLLPFAFEIVEDGGKPC